MSRWMDYDNWKLRDSTVNRMRVAFGQWEVDHFADHLNAKATQFNSLFLHARDSWCGPFHSGLGCLCQSAGATTVSNHEGSPTSSGAQGSWHPGGASMEGSAVVPSC